MGGGTRCVLLTKPESPGRCGGRGWGGGVAMVDRDTVIHESSLNSLNNMIENREQGR